jgi:ABC-type branched-subunit amino acid transport system permease subunit
MYVTGFLAAIVVVITIVATIIYLVTATPAESAKGIALSMLNGISTTVGAFVGGLLVLRFKSVREFLQRTIHDRPDVKFAHHLKETMDPWNVRLLNLVNKRGGHDAEKNDCPKAEDKQGDSESNPK